MKKRKVVKSSLETVLTDALEKIETIVFDESSQSPKGLHQFHSELETVMNRLGQKLFIELNRELEKLPILLQNTEILLRSVETLLANVLTLHCEDPHEMLEEICDHVHLVLDDLEIAVH